MDLEEETVTIRRLPGEDLSVREVRISCPDATGLGVDIARMLLDFGLRVLKGDISTDGKWCFLIFRVALSSGVPPRWQLLKQRLEGICPSGTDTLQQLWRWRSICKDQPPFLLQVSGYDRQGMLHSLSQSLWEANLTTFKAHITTSPGGKVSDLFWLYDNRGELPETHRVLEICDRVKGALGPDTECTITPAPPDSLAAGAGTSSALGRKACKDVTSASNLRRIVGSKKQVAASGSGDSLGSLGAAGAAPGRDSLVERQAAEVEVGVDNETSSAHSMMSLRCADRKGLLYDLFRSLKDIDLRVAYGRVEVCEGGWCEVDLFIQDQEGARVTDNESLAELTQRVRTAVALPVRIDLRDAFDACATELTVTANIDSGGRGRPRVTFDVTQGLSAAGVGVFMADVYIEQPELGPYGAPLVDGPPAQEMHRFLITAQNGQAIRGEREKKAIYDVVKAHLLGTSVAQQQLLAAASGAAGAGPPLAGAASVLSGGGAALGAPAGSSQQDAGQHSLLRALSGKWRGAQL